MKLQKVLIRSVQLESQNLKEQMKKFPLFAACCSFIVLISEACDEEYVDQIGFVKLGTYSEF